MAPYNNNYGDHYDPVGSQYSQQHQPGYSYSDRRPSQTMQYQEPASSATPYPSSYTTSYSTGAYHGWNSAALQTPHNVEDRAAEALSHLSARDQAPGATSSLRASSTQYAGQISTYGLTSNATHSMPSQQTSAGASSTYPANQPSKGSAPTYFNTKSYSAPNSQIYSYPLNGDSGHSQPSSVTQASARPSQSHVVNAHQFTAPNVIAGPGQQLFRQTNSHMSEQQPRDRGQPTKVGDDTRANTAKTGNNVSYSQDHRSANVGQPRAPSLVHGIAQHEGEQRQPSFPETLGPTTVDPSQVYDAWPEQQRRIREAEARRKAEETAKAEVQQEEARKAAATEAMKRAHEQKQVELENPVAREASSTAIRSGNGLSTSQPSEAAMAFASASGALPGSDLEAEMLAMFKKMREFNEKNPAMLARIWEQERRAHVAKTTSPAAATTPVQPASVQATQRPSDTPQAVVFANPPSTATTNMSLATEKPNGGQPSVPLVSVQPGSSGIWPPGKKAHLAEAALKWLIERPENRGKQVTVDWIMNLLDSNPSYTELCQMLEQKGLIVDRAPFARALLRVVPGMNKPQPELPRPTFSSTFTNGESTTAPSASNSAGPHLSTASKETVKKGPPDIRQPGNIRGWPKKDVATNQPVPEIGTFQRVITQPTSQAGPTAHMTSTAPRITHISGASISANLPTQSHPSAPPHTYKEAQGPGSISQSSPYFQRPATSQQAKTASSSRQLGQTSVPSPLHVPSRPPANKEEAARKRTFAELIDLTAVEVGSDEEMEPPAKRPELDPVSQGESRSITMDPSLLGTNQPSSRGAFNHNMYSGIESSNRALGQTPGMHKPGQPALNSLEKELDGKILVQGIQREKVARKSQYDPRTICRDVLLATGRHPDIRALNEHLFQMHDFLKRHSVNVEGDKLDLGTIRWDLIDPGEPMVDMTNDKLPEAATDADDEGEEVSDATRQERIIDHDPAHRRKPFARRGPGRPRKSMAYINTSRETSPGNTSAEHISKPQASIANATSTAASARSSEEPSTLHPPVLAFTPMNKPPTTGGAPTSIPVGYAAFKEQNPTAVDEFGRPIKRRGRPVGWRKSLHSKAAVAVASGQAPSPSSAISKPPPATGSYDQVVKRKGRPPKHSPLTNRDPEPVFNVYKCEWQDCRAELHNVDTLRKHVIKLHGRVNPEGNYKCFWKDCSTHRGSDVHKHFLFDKMEDWMEHIESAHLVPVMRQLGDGPRHGLSEPRDSEASDSYLSDATGRIITPKVRPSPVAMEDSPDVWKAQVARNLAAKRLTDLRGVRLENEKLLQQLEQQKRVIGPGLDRAGCTFATAQRRKGFFDDEDFEDLIERDEFEE